MTKNPVFSFAVWLLAFFLSAQQSHGQQMPKTVGQELGIPTDGKKLVFEFDTSGGYRAATPAGFQPTPILSVYADGRVVTGVKTPGIKSSERVLSRKELETFLNFVVNRQRLYSITIEKIQEQVKASGSPRPVTMDASVSKFRTSLERGKHSVEIYGLEYAAKSYRTIPELQQLKEIQDRSRQLVAWANLGSEDKGKTMLSQLNKKLATEFPKVPKFSIADFRFVTNFEDGRFQVSLAKEVKPKGGGPVVNVYARISTKPDSSTPDISFSVPQELR